MQLLTLSPYAQDVSSYSVYSSHVHILLLLLFILAAAAVGRLAAAAALAALPPALAWSAAPAQGRFDRP